MSTIDQLKPVDTQKTNLYLPYIPGNKKSFLPYAISLYQKGYIEGNRKIEGGENIPFIATWNVGTLPADLARCRIQFDGNAELTYEVMMASFEFINFLIELMEQYKRHKNIDFSTAFYRKLLRIED